MPHANIWIRKDDWELWEKVENKSEFISRALNPPTPKSITEPIKPRPQNNFFTESKPIVKQAKSNFSFCKNGHPIPEGRDSCMGKGCKYS
jgi:hypothetical protein